MNQSLPPNLYSKYSKIFVRTNIMILFEITLESDCLHLYNTSKHEAHFQFSIYTCTHIYTGNSKKLKREEEKGRGGNFKGTAKDTL